MLLNSSNSPISKGVIYGIAFYCYLWNDNADLIKKISNILHENDEIKLVFLDELHKYLSVINSASDPPFKITVSQIEILEKLSEPPNHPEIRAKTKEQLNYIHELIENKIITRILNDYS
jgi:hypothetical protein